MNRGAEYPAEGRGEGVGDQQEVKMQKTISTSNVKLVEVEVRVDSLEEELYEKNLRVQEKRWRRS